MAERPQFDWSKISPADRILAIAGALFFVDTFLPWQRACTPGVRIGSVTFLRACGSANAWRLNGAFFGIVAGILAIALLVWMGLQLSGSNLDLGFPPARVSAGLAGGTVVFGLLKFILVIGKFLAFGAWVGLILLLALAYGAYMKLQEPAQGGTSTGPPSPPASSGFGS